MRISSTLWPLRKRIMGSTFVMLVPCWWALSITAIRLIWREIRDRRKAPKSPPRPQVIEQYRLVRSALPCFQKALLSLLFSAAHDQGIGDQNLRLLGGHHESFLIIQILVPYLDPSASHLIRSRGQASSGAGNLEPVKVNVAILRRIRTLPSSSVPQLTDA